MNHEVFTLLLIGLMSCNYGEIEPKLEDALINQNQSVELRSPTDGTSSPSDTVTLEELCVGCGCERDYKRCKKSTVHSCHLEHSDDPEGQKECCNDIRTDCHKCDGGAWICIRFRVASGPIQSMSLGDFLEEHGDGSLPSDVSGVIDKFESELPLTSADLEIIDDIVILN